MVNHNRNHKFSYGETEVMAEGLVRVTANNPGPFTFHGSGTFILGKDSLAIIDPGPDLDSHFHALIIAIDGRPVTHILVTHRHADHAGLARRMANHLGTPIYAWGDTPAADNLKGESSTRDFYPDNAILHNQILSSSDWQVQAIHTPGHTSDHICFIEHNRKWVFCGDHVMGWSTSVVLPPDGNMGAYVRNLRTMQIYKNYVFWPTHGSEILHPCPYLDQLIEHRTQREQAILDILAQGVEEIDAMVKVIYRGVDKSLHRAAGQSVLATLIDLQQRKLVIKQPSCSGDLYHLSGRQTI
ncbi:MAG: glyoxylase-like metal-dependent hydrolase (beta-lactamase superfamily II) [Parasphingorhabdus sp.]